MQTVKDLVTAVRFLAPYSVHTVTLLMIIRVCSAGPTGVDLG